MPKFLRSRKVVVTAAVVGVGALGIGVAGAVGGVGSTPGPSDESNGHAAPEATGSSLPPAASAGSGNAATAGADNAADPAVPETAGTPDIGEAPASIPDAALNATEGTPGNTVLNDLLNTAPGADRGATISGDMQQDLAPTTPTVPDTAHVPDAASGHKP
jgi:hypothetical protein